uniref:Uncharacterized protein n=1 Tax=Manihot esculenta TaxID=3983 RepID=A0A2C9WFB7_MANES
MFTSTKLDWICTKSPNQYDGSQFQRKKMMVTTIWHMGKCVYHI